MFQIPCTIDDLGKDADINMCEFWETSRDWLRLRGVQLYDLRPESKRCISKVWHTPLTSTPAGLPYARCIAYEGISSKTLQTAVCTGSHARSSTCPNFAWQTRLACGQDVAGRDIMLKLVDKDSSQYRIFQTLLRQKSLFTSFGTFPGVLPPVAIIDTPHKYSIVTMPR